MRPGESQTILKPTAEHVASLPINDPDVTCRALQVALRAVQLYIAWHSGVMSGNVAMAALEQEINQASSRLRN